MSRFTKATRHKVFLKLAITGPTGSVKTYSALRLATGLANGGRVALLDSENQSGSLYADKFPFDVLNIFPPYNELKFIEAIKAAVAEGYTVLIIDSLSHAWLWVLDYKAGLDARGGNSYINWNRAGTKFHDLLAAILQSGIHIICCLRSKMDYVLEPNDKGKMVPRRVGMAPICRDGVEFEFSIIFDGDLEHQVSVSKDRTGLFVDQRFQITEETGTQLLAWLNSAPEAEPEKPTTPNQESAPAKAEGAEGIWERLHDPLFSTQERLRNALFALPEDWITDFLIDRKQIVAGQTILDAPADYCEEAIRRIVEFRDTIAKFGESREHIPT